MADAILNLVSTSPTGGGGSTTSTAPATSCPIFYPTDLAALQGLPSASTGLCPIPGGSTSGAGSSTPYPTLQGYVAEIDDTLRFSILVTGGPKTVTFYGTRIASDGSVYRFSQNVIGNSSTVPATAFIPTGPGIIQGVGATAVGGIGAATIYVLAELGNIEGQTFFPHAQLLSGLLTGFGVAAGTTTVGGGGGGGVNTNCWATQTVIDVTSDPHWIYDVTVAAGTVDRLLNVTFTAVTSATVKNRTVSVGVAMGGVDIFRWWDPTAMTAGQTKNYIMIPGATYSTQTDALSNINITIPFPSGFIFDLDWELDVGFVNVDGSDVIVNRALTYQVQTC